MRKLTNLLSIIIIVELGITLSLMFTTLTGRAISIEILLGFLIISILIGLLILQRFLKRVI